MTNYFLMLYLKHVRQDRPTELKTKDTFMEFKSTKASDATTVNFLVYGAAGSGKTFLIKTLPNPVILSAESGLMSINDVDLPYLEISTLDQLKQAYRALAKDESFESIAIDSISEIAEVVLAHEKANAKDPRQAYGAMQDQMIAIIRAFRNLNKNIYMSCKLEKAQDELGRMLYYPAMPGNKTAQQLPYLFDEVLAMRVEKNQDGEIVRGLQCQSDGLWLAKDRSGKLDAWEAPNLGAIINKIKGV